ncbi:hypothetical protein STPYR_10199 [uncultured Stenotrophomonas sp.]|uniref:Uncharacterized protein n=1 Tax=uncultured Stenotrophomonas sp. TaxID=165438 RepID=A0A1Y5PZ49_9GAMM|nr:hypothetical protein STPYR_10199 [uncultured Stenotrophomonas sp.]
MVSILKTFAENFCHLFFGLFCCVDNLANSRCGRRDYSVVLNYKHSFIVIFYGSSGQVCLLVYLYRVTETLVVYDKLIHKHPQQFMLIRLVRRC